MAGDLGEGGSERPFPEIRKCGFIKKSPWIPCFPATWKQVALGKMPGDFVTLLRMSESRGRACTAEFTHV